MNLLICWEIMILYSILEQVKGDRIYSIILDCTPDINHDEQMSLVLRQVHTSTDIEVVVHEHFTGFLKVAHDHQFLLGQYRAQLKT